MSITHPQTILVTDESPGPNRATFPPFLSTHCLFPSSLPLSHAPFVLPATKQRLGSFWATDSFTLKPVCVDGTWLSATVCFGSTLGDGGSEGMRGGAGARRSPRSAPELAPGWEGKRERERWWIMADLLFQASCISFWEVQVAVRVTQDWPHAGFWGRSQMN